MASLFKKNLIFIIAFKMGFTRRNFIATTILGGMGVMLPFPSWAKPKAIQNINQNYAKLDKVLKETVLKKELFSSPIIIETLELLRYNDNFLCRVRSADGVEGFSFGNNDQMKSLFPVFVNRMKDFFIGKDARDLESLLDQVYVYQSNYKLQGIAIWVPLATIEFAILDMLGKIANRPIGDLITIKVTLIC